MRIEGRVERVSPEESDTYFHSRPLKSRLGAHRVAPERTDREPRCAGSTRCRGGTAVWRAAAAPQHWGGYRLVPERIEFWQGRRSRFHDRIVYMRQADGSWERKRLQP